MDIMISNTQPTWKRYRLGQLFHERKTKVSDKNFPPLSVTMQGILPQLDTAAKTDDGDNRKFVRRGDYVINSRSDRKGSGGISEFDGSVSLISIVLEPKGIHPAFAHHLLRSRAFQEEFYRWGHGIVADLWTTRYADMKNIRLALPDFETQKAIAVFLDRETARIGQLIERKQGFLSAIAERLEALVAETLTSDAHDWVRFQHLAERVQRPAILSEHQELVRLGLYNRGRGIFKKPATDEDGMGDSTFSFIRDGDLILSGQFAWEGAVAMAAREEDSCVVSHRYPVYRGRLVQTPYLLALFRSKHGNFILNDASRGSAGRNRPLNTWRLGKERLPIPPTALQDEIEKTINLERELRKKNADSIDRLREYHAALITAAVTGQIDVATFDRRGTADRTLDRIEEEMQA